MIVSYIQKCSAESTGNLHRQVLRSFWLNFCVDADQCVYVGDNLEKDFLSPNQMGFKTVRVVRKRRIHFGKAPSSQAEAHYEIDSVTKLPDLLKEINGV